VSTASWSSSPTWTDGAAREVARHRRGRAGETVIDERHYPPPPPGSIERRPRANTDLERAFLALGDGAKDWLIAAAAAGMSGIHARMQGALDLRAFHDAAAVDAALAWRPRPSGSGVRTSPASWRTRRAPCRASTPAPTSSPACRPAPAPGAASDREPRRERRPGAAGRDRAPHPQAQAALREGAPRRSCSRPPAANAGIPPKPSGCCSRRRSPAATRAAARPPPDGRLPAPEDLPHLARGRQQHPAARAARPTGAGVDRAAREPHPVRRQRHRQEPLPRSPRASRHRPRPAGGLVHARGPRQPHAPPPHRRHQRQSHQTHQPRRPRLHRRHRPAPRPAPTPPKASSASSTPPTSGAAWRSAATSTPATSTPSCPRPSLPPPWTGCLHHAHVIQVDGDSFRLKEATAGKGVIHLNN
jgi:hypothetical protein